MLRVFRESNRASSAMTSALAVSLKRAIEFSIAVEKMKARVFDDWQKQAETSKVTFAQVILDVQKPYIQLCHHSMVEWKCLQRN